MRAFISLLVVVFASIGIGIGALGASGSDHTGASYESVGGITSPLRVADIYLQSLDKSSSEMITLTAPHLSTATSQLLSNLRIVLAESTNSGAPLSEASGTNDVNVDLNVQYQSNTLADIRFVAPDKLYGLVDIGTILKLPLHLSQSTETMLQGLSVLVSNRWFELPPGLLTRLGTEKTATPPAPAGLGPKIAHALSQAIESKSLSVSGSTETVTLAGRNGAVARAIAPALPSISGLGALPLGNLHLGALAGAYRLLLVGSTSGILQSVDFQDSASGGIEISAAFTLSAPSIIAPSGATEIPPSVFRNLHLPGVTT